MASAFGHAFSAYAISKAFNDKTITAKLVFLGMFSSIIPDADVIAFKFGIPYESMWGHRGISHSILFAGLWALFFTMLFYKRNYIQRLMIFIYLFLATVSHGLLDGMTSGGKGVAFLAPFDNTRYFLPFRPIKVSPIGASQFFSQWGLDVLASEMFWIGFPCIVFMILCYVVKKMR